MLRFEVEAVEAKGIHRTHKMFKLLKETHSRRFTETCTSDYREFYNLLPIVQGTNQQSISGPGEIHHYSTNSQNKIPPMSLHYLVVEKELINFHERGNFGENLKILVKKTRLVL